jgi:hypothetical protein
VVMAVVSQPQILNGVLLQLRVLVMALVAIKANVHFRSYLDLDVNTVDLRGSSEDCFGSSAWAAHTFFLHLFFSRSGLSPSARSICMVHRDFSFEDALSITNFCVH